jgi:hypothetical protein
MSAPTVLIVMKYVESGVKGEREKESLMLCKAISQP